MVDTVEEALNVRIQDVNIAGVQGVPDLFDGIVGSAATPVGAAGIAQQRVHNRIQILVESALNQRVANRSEGDDAFAPGYLGDTLLQKGTEDPSVLQNLAMDGAEMLLPLFLEDLPILSVGTGG
nr:hypothetical protein [Rhabdochromatium marinum]